MTKQRFEELTGIYISEYQYGIIEEFYLQDGYSEEEFCNRYKKNENGLAQSIQRVTDIVTARHEERMRKQLEEQQSDLDRLLAAKPDPVMERVKCKDAAKRTEYGHHGDAVSPAAGSSADRLCRKAGGERTGRILHLQRTAG